MVYIKYLEQCLKHRTRSINISHPCCYYYLHFMGASVYTCARTQDPARLSGDLSCQLPYCHLQVALTKEATEFCILSFLFFRSPCVRPRCPPPKIPPPGHCLPSPSPSPRSLGKEGQGTSMERTRTSCSQ